MFETLWSWWSHMGGDLYLNHRAQDEGLVGATAYWKARAGAKRNGGGWLCAACVQMTADRRCFFSLFWLNCECKASSSFSSRLPYDKRSSTEQKKLDYLSYVYWGPHTSSVCLVKGAPTQQHVGGVTHKQHLPPVCCLTPCRSILT